MARHGDVRNWKNLHDAEVIVYHYWAGERMPIESVDEKTGLVKCSRTSVFGLKGCTTPHWSDYFVENVFEGLSAPGEWYLDTPEGRLYYVPMPGESPDKTEVVAAGTYQFLRLMGDPAAGKFVTGLTFRGLTFRYSDWIQPEFDGKYFDPYLPEEKRRRQDDTDCFYLHQMSYWKQGTKYANSPQSAVSVPGAIVMVGASDSPRLQRGESCQSFVTISYGWLSK